jgi:ATP-binding protein involved in chromosome partitioning
MPLTSRHLHDALKTVKDPDLRRDIVSLNLVRDVRIAGDDVHLVIEVAADTAARENVRADIEHAVKSKAKEVGESLGSITVEFVLDLRKTNQVAKDDGSPLPAIRHVIAVGAGKGGVGKSSVSVNLAVGLARMGHQVGLLDADIYGPSAPTMLGLEDIPTRARGNILLPFEVHGIRAMTMGKLADPDKALIWRGPMAHGAFKQLAMQTEWGDLDYLIVDLPPGTGDVPLTLAQTLPLTGAVIVCTPQIVAQDDARRAVRMFQQLGVEIIGVVENMSYFIGDDGKIYDLFGRGGAQIMAETMGLPYLGAIPINTALRTNADLGTPLKNWDTQPLASELDALCQTVVSRVNVLQMQGRLEKPTLSIR